VNHRLDTFIVHFAQKIASIYPNNCAEEEDYIQAGHLKLAEISKSKQKKRNFLAYAIVAIARAMRDTAISTMYSVTAPRRVKKQIHDIEILLAAGKTEQEICQKLKITHKTFTNLLLLIGTESWHLLFEEPTYNSKPFFALNDLLSSGYLTKEDKAFIQAQFNGNLRLDRKKRWLKATRIRPKLIRSGYEI
jgi:DNA-directed RNA polymerase specialized sigma subunit